MHARMPAPRRAMAAACRAGAGRWHSGVSGATLTRGPGCATAPASAGASCRDRARPTPRRGEGAHERRPRRGRGGTAAQKIRRGRLCHMVGGQAGIIVVGRLHSTSSA